MIDVRSDTVTLPSDEMLKAMYEAKVGDDILGEDPTVRELEKLGAEILGKEAALFVTSGTMANQVAIMTLTERGEEIIVGMKSHIYNLEVGALSALSQVQARPMEFIKGKIEPLQIEELIRTEGIQQPKTSLLCLENSYDLNKGYPVTLDDTIAACEMAHRHGLRVYLDGARIFNAAAALNVSPAKLAEPADAVQICLTKGLCAPVGSLLVGSKNFIEKARWIRQRIGGGMRQAGYIAAAGIVGLQTMMPQIACDNHNAYCLAKMLSEINSTLVDPEDVKTNIVTIDIRKTGISAEEFLEQTRSRQLAVKFIGNNQFRMICHRGIDIPEIHTIVSTVSSVLSAK